MTIEFLQAFPAIRQWHSEDGVSVTGSAFHRATNEYLGSRAIARLFVNSVDSSTVLPQLNGNFAIVSTRESACFAAVDHTRSNPLFYAIRERKLLVSDDALLLARAITAPPAGGVAAATFLMQGHTVGRMTLADGVFQLTAGQYIECQHHDARVKHWFVPFERAVSDEFDGVEHETELLDRAISIHESAIDRLVRSVDGRPIAVPLSGGLDSRLLVAMLVQAGMSDITCFTYGRANGFEVRSSQAVAAKLNLDWHHIPYSSKGWHDTFASPAYQAYRSFASRLTAIEHEQDWPAVKQLVASGVLSKEHVVVPGHSLDFLAGSHLPDEAFESSASSDPIAWIFAKYLNLWFGHELSESLAAMTRTAVGANFSKAERAISNNFERYGMEERQSKMIINSVRAYEFHRLDWRLPWWDRDLVDFWSGVPLAARRAKRLYMRLHERIAPDLMSITYVPPQPPKLIEALRRATDRDYSRYGLYLGPSPSRTVISRRIDDFVHIEDPILDAIIAKVRNLPAQRVPLNALTAMFQYQDSLEAISSDVG